MGIRFKDFRPEETSPGGLLTQPAYESLKETVAAANEWIGEKGIRVLNVETVVLPNLALRESTHEPRMMVVTDHVAWYQIIRVWYEVSD